MAGSSKKVIVRTLTGDVHAGYLPGSGFVEQADGQPTVSLLDLDGRVTPVLVSKVRYIAYVRDFNRGQSDPERLNRRTFLARPRSEGLWIRLTFCDGETLEGLAPADLTLADGLLEDFGIFLIPPDIRSNTQRLYVPRAALTACNLLAVITNPSRQKPLARTASHVEAQESLFPDAAPPRNAQS